MEHLTFGTQSKRHSQLPNIRQQRARAEVLGRRLIATWNEGDLEEVLTCYADPLEYTSPLVEERLRRPGGVIRSKQELSGYFSIGLAAYRGIKFEFITCLHGIGETTFIYFGVKNIIVGHTVRINQAGLIFVARMQYELEGFEGSVFASNFKDEVVWI